MRTTPIAVFMAFGTKGDVYPIAAIAAAFAVDMEQYNVFFITHSAHEGLKVHLEAKTVVYLPVSSPPALAPHDDSAPPAGSKDLSFSLQKREITRDHRRECVSIVERIFGDGLSLQSDLMVINFFALEGWSLAELFHLRCVVAAPYVVPYSAPSSYEGKFRKELPDLYKYLKEAPDDKVGWKDVIHWMWPLFTDEWGSWRNVELRLSACPFTDPVTGLPAWHDRPSSPLILYGFSKEVVECPGYWPSRVQVSGFWFLPSEWQFSCNKCAEISALVSSMPLNTKDELCSTHVKLQSFMSAPAPELPIFIGLSSIGSMGLMRNPQAFLQVIENVIGISSHRFLLFSAGYGPLDTAINSLAQNGLVGSERRQSSRDGVSIFGGRLFCYSGIIPYNWLFPRCAAVIHHGGSGSTAAALRSGTPQVICPFLMDQFYWAERMFWIGVAPEPLKRHQLLPDKDEDLCIREVAEVVARAIGSALSVEVRARALDIAKRISSEDGVSQAVQALKEELGCLGSRKGYD
ncbi:sterol 3-beta-glucosyltransferase UGT80A2-like isoform X1 [Coffea arabica]|uniref:Sterol 3-beta-glucosyltransferase UGT80A2-like isoform X1 n=1 Tax=Coffea arabica TaxID=13443 RepID=A0ABM4WHB9_COFAR